MSEKSTPFVSIYSPVYNAEKYIKEAVESILNQSYTNFEYIIINDCSTDNSLDVLKSFNDPRIRIVENEVNKGIIYNRNLAISEAKGKYLFCLDADDLYKPNRMKQMVDYFESHPEANYLTTNAFEFFKLKFLGRQTIDISPAKSLQDYFKSLVLFQNPFVGGAMAFRVSFLRENNISYDLNHKNTEDFGMWQRILYKTEVHIINQQLYVYRFHNDSDTAKANHKLQQRLATLSLVYREMLERFGFPISEDELRIHMEISLLSLLKDQLKFSFEDKLNWTKKLLEYNQKSGLIGEEDFKYVLSYQLSRTAIFLEKVKEYKSSEFQEFYPITSTNLLKIRIKQFLIKIIRKILKR